MREVTKEELEKILESHKIWVATGGEEGSRADLRRANLRWANLWRADLWRADLWRADLSGANLSGANLTGANLSGANLTGTFLRGADLTEANLMGAQLPETKVELPKGEIEAWKKMRDGILARVTIPEDAERTANIVSRKCRASAMTVCETFHKVDGKWEPTDLEEVRPWREESDMVYKVGERVEDPNYNNSFTDDCLPGLHFFTTRKEAEDW